jgi:GGDEF domain-containing protein
MAASDPHQHPHNASPEEEDDILPSGLRARLHEEIARAERQGTGLSCLLIRFENLAQLAREHGAELEDQTLTYVIGALRAELRCFDRVDATTGGDVVLLLPGADSPRGEIVARRTLGRLRTIKVESAGVRVALDAAVGLAAWRDGMSAATLLAQAQSALRAINGDSGAAGEDQLTALAPSPSTQAPHPQESPGAAPALGRLGGQ